MSDTYTEFRCKEALLLCFCKILFHGQCQVNATISVRGDGEFCENHYANWVMFVFRLTKLFIYINDIKS